ncbi:hypothetical protein FRE64_01120 [Euhalothece natronophila Z-M001]|uniref:Sulfotransferase family protein n=1 Tax=Euhalothece natronophila Z-M001 TaxID=522448 RepID=A0A5B8NI68_9CHRO|nr:sulfotransferase [Euhalothece natronophila]QDZ38664.1 hypothetical protein FRE64_01120 [Euhalothece natronophila Z-M001]
MSNSTSPILIITGMHRSGTSLTASLLQSGGVDLGKDFNPSMESKVKEYFEDLAVVRFHENVLKAHHLPPEGWVHLEKITQIPEPYLTQAKEIIASKRDTTKGMTGWKDPRGTLFLDFWQSQLPEAQFIFLYRAPWEVVDSLYRRGDPIFTNSPQLALDFWLNYNAALINFYDRYPDKSLLLNIDRIINDPTVLSRAIAQKFRFNLSVQSEIYNSSLFQTDISHPLRCYLFQQFFPEASQLYQELQTRCEFCHSQHELSDLPMDRNWLLQDWLQMRVRQKQQQKIQQELSEKNARITELEELIKAMESSKFWKMRQFWMQLKQRFPFLNR